MHASQRAPIISRVSAAAVALYSYLKMAVLAYLSTNTSTQRRIDCLLNSPTKPADHIIISIRARTICVLEYG